MSRLLRTGAAAALVLLVAGCDYGDTRVATDVADTSARLEGFVHTDGAETVTWWFEYGPTWDLGSSTPETDHTTAAAGAEAVHATVTGLAEGTPYVYRHCVRNGDDAVVCGARQPLTTTSGRDSVHGSWVYDDPFSSLIISAVAHATSEPDGGAPEGSGSTLPGSLQPDIADEGPVRCLRVSGNLAAVGFVADRSAFGEPDAYVVLHIEDDPAGDSYWVVGVDDEPTSCPEPGVVPFGTFEWPVPAGSFTVHDHP